MVYPPPCPPQPPANAAKLVAAGDWEGPVVAEAVVAGVAAWAGAFAGEAGGLVVRVDED
jgi:hypothetical protein